MKEVSKKPTALRTPLAVFAAALASALAAAFTVILLLSFLRFPVRVSASRETRASVEAPPVSLSLDDAQSARPLTLLACGDVLLSRSVADRINQYGYQWPFRNSRDLVSGADIAFCNLENAASFLGRPWLGKPENVTFRASPGALFGLKWAGFDVVSLANNHVTDFGPEALRETLEYLDMLGIARAGAGADAESARDPAILTRKGGKVAFLAYVEAGLGVLPAGERPGAVYMDTERLAADIAEIRQKENPDYLIVSVHWGDEHQSQPRASQRDFGHAAIDAGATLVLGHHPHVLQPLEVYRSGVIVYSLGNFVFDMAADGTYDTAAVLVSLAQGGIRGVEILPLRIERYDYAPRPATPREADRILTGLRENSRILGTAVEIVDGRGFVRMVGGYPTDGRGSPVRP